MSVPDLGQQWADAERTADTQALSLLARCESGDLHHEDERRSTRADSRPLRQRAVPAEPGESSERAS
jgi:hypothetical protein